MVVWQLSSVNKLVYKCIATVTSCAIHAYVSCLHMVSRWQTCTTIFGLSTK